MSSNKEIEFMVESAKRFGAACGTVKDGHVLIFNRSHLKDLLEKSNEEMLVIFVKRPEFKG
jgi:hypothetical protein